MKAITRTMRILFVEDNEDQAHLIKRLLKRCEIASDVEHAADGELALQALEPCAESSEKQLPDLIILDLNLPKRSGHEVLSYVKHEERLKQIPVVIFTSSDAKEDRAKAYQEHANSYIVKPLDLEGLREVVDRLSQYWGKMNTPAKDAA